MTDSPYAMTQAEERIVFKPGSAFKMMERNFLGSGWTFIEISREEAYWFYPRTGKMIPSSRNCNFWRSNGINS